MDDKEDEDEGDDDGSYTAEQSENQPEEEEVGDAEQDLNCFVCSKWAESCPNQRGSVRIKVIKLLVGLPSWFIKEPGDLGQSSTATPRERRRQESIVRHIASKADDLLFYMF